MSQPKNSPSPQATLPRSQAEIAARVKALESIMIDKGLMTTEAVDRFAEIYENEVGPQLGAQVVAKAWTDPEFKKRLLEDGTKACAELGIGGLQGEDTPMEILQGTETNDTVTTPEGTTTHGIGPIHIPAGGGRSVWIAFVAGSTLNELRRNAMAARDEAQARRAGTFTLVQAE